MTWLCDETITDICCKTICWFLMSSDDELIETKVLFKKKGGDDGGKIDGYEARGDESDEDRVVQGLDASDEKGENLVESGMGYEPEEPIEEGYGEDGEFHEGLGEEGYGGGEYEEEQLFEELEQKKGRKSRKTIWLDIPENPGDVNYVRILKTTTNPTFVFFLGCPFLTLYTLLSPITSFHLGMFVACSASSIWAFVIGVQMLAEDVENINDCYLIPAAYLLIYVGVGGIATSICAAISMCVQVIQHTNSAVSREDPERMFEPPDQSFSWYVSISFQLLFLVIELSIALPTLMVFIGANVLLGFNDCEDNSDYHSMVFIWVIVSYSLIVVGGAIPCFSNCAILFRS